MSQRTDARGSTTGRPHVVWFAAGSASAAVTGGLLAALYITSAIGWSLEGRSPGSGWLGIVMGVVVGGIVGGIGIGIQRRASIPRVSAPLIALALLVLLGIIVWVVLIPFDANGSLRYGVAVIASLVTIATVLGTAIVALTNSALWLRVGGMASALIAVSLVIGLLQGG
ncbi:hypothetical protein [Frigoribacterium sp. UYMn621]|uniref:hypothetical protein n=1 Tax=Frigoribacterium sp. UYMn621 TaxID=3156343 RepID=UPI00339861CA